MLPYDGSGGGNALGAQIDAARLRIHNDMVNSVRDDWEPPRSAFQVAVYLLAVAIFLTVMLY